MGTFMNQLHFIVAGDIKSPGNHYWQQHTQCNDAKGRRFCVSMAKFSIMVTLLTLLALHTKIQNKMNMYTVNQHTTIYGYLLQIYTTCFGLSIIFQQDATTYSLLYLCKLLYMFRVLNPPIIRSTYNCNYSIWHWSNL